MRDVLEIPAPITEQNKDEYLEELSKINESEDWIKKHSVENKSSINENKIVQNHNISDKQVLSNFFEAIIENFGPVILFFILLPALAIILFAFFLYELGGFHAFPFG